MVCRALSLMSTDRSDDISPQFFTDLESLFEGLSTLTTPCLLAGDFNVRLDRPGTPSCVQFNDLLAAYGLRQHVDEPTHQRGGTLDAVVSSADLEPTNIRVIDVGVSDHSLVQWSLDIPVSNVPVYVTRERRMWKTFDKEKFRSELLSSCLCEPADTAEICEQLSSDDLVGKYNKTVAEILDRLAPTTSSTVRVRPRSDPWFDDECRAAKRHARRLERRCKRWKSVYARNAWIKALHNSHGLAEKKRCSFWKSKVDEQSDARSTWKVVDDILLRDQPKSTDTSLSANDLADFFDKKISDIRSATENAPPPTFTDNPSGVEFQSFTPLSIDDTLRLIKDAPMKQCASDPLPTWLLKDCADLFAPYIKRIINESLTSGYVPTGFKQAYITPILKKPGLDENVAANYRPVSNLSVLSKLLERAVSRQLNGHLISSGLFPSHQSAYRKPLSTETILARVCSDLFTRLDNGDCATIAFLDLSAAFDTVDSEILLSRLSKSFGIGSSALMWIRSYLEDRSEYVSFNGKQSPTRKVKFGVPQGSVLGPLLFVLYTADLQNIAQQHSVYSHYYADDSQFYIFSRPTEAGTSEQQLLACLDDVAQWMCSNRLSLNPAKTQFMRCATPRRLGQLSESPITFCGETITPVKSVRNLGVIIDCSLTFQLHISKVVSSCFYQLRRLKSCLSSLPFDTAKTIMNCFVISRIDYCNSLLAGVPQYSIDRLQRVMNAAARMLWGAGPRAHVSGLLRQLHWLRVQQRIDYKLCLLVYKARHGMAPGYLSELCRPVADNPSQIKTRSATRGNLNIPSTDTKFGDRAFATAGMRAWNRLPAAIRPMDISLGTFKNKLKSHYFNIN